MSIINLLANDLWSEADIVNHGRAVINSQVSSERQQELQTIMLGHIAGMRTAAPEELAEIGFVAQITELQSQQNALARADMTLLQGCLGYEAAVARLALPLVTEPEFITVEGIETPNPAIAQDAAERAAAEAVVAGAQQATLDLYVLRNPALEPEPMPEPTPEVTP